jgi:hypothetical protein
MILGPVETLQHLEFYISNLKPNHDLLKHIISESGDPVPVMIMILVIIWNRRRDRDRHGSGRLYLSVLKSHFNLATCSLSETRGISTL